MTAREFADTVISLPVELQNEFFSAIKGNLSEADYMATVEHISVWGLFNRPAKYKAMKEAIKAVLFEDIYGHEYDEADYYGAKSLRGFEDFERSGYYASLPGVQK